MAKINFVERKREVERMSRKEAREVINKLKVGRTLRVYNTPICIRRKNKNLLAMYTTMCYTEKKANDVVKWLTGKEICWK